MENSNRTKSWFWMAYFLINIVVIGSTLGYVLTLPFFLLSRWFPWARRVADRNTVQGIGFLMGIQPWLSARIELPVNQIAPRGSKGCLLVSNHRSHLDAFILLSRVEGIRILAKSSLFFIPGLAAMMRMTRQIPVKRGNLQSFLESMERVRQRLRQGERVHVFAEMTRCPPGFQGTQEFMLAPFHAALQEKALIVPVVFDGTDRVWPKGSTGLVFRAPFQVKALEPIQPGFYESAEALRDETRRRINQALV